MCNLCSRVGGDGHARDCVGAAPHAETAAHRKEQSTQGAACGAGGGILGTGADVHVGDAADGAVAERVQRELRGVERVERVECVGEF